METTVEKSRSFVASQLGELKERRMHLRPRRAGPAVTISHQTGAGAREIAERLARRLEEAAGEGGRAWTVFDRQLVEKALEEHHLPAALAKRMPEDGRAYVDDVMDELFGLRPPSWVLVPQVAETIARLAEVGCVILIGRGAAVVTSQMPNVFHVRLIASLAKRVERVQRLHGMTAREAARFVAKEDRGRQRYVKTNFHTRLDDDLLYHLVINTDRIPCAEAAELIAHAARRCFAGEPP